MSFQSRDYTDCNVLIYDVRGKLLVQTIVREHDKKSMYIKVDKKPDINVHEHMKLLIMSSPVPSEFFGRFIRIGREREIALFQGKEREMRQASRYQVELPAQIEGHIEAGAMNPITPPLEVKLINISTNGLRFSSSTMEFRDGQLIQMRLKIGDNDQKMSIQVVHRKRVNDAKLIEFGCRIVNVEQLNVNQ